MRHKIENRTGKRSAIILSAVLMILLPACNRSGGNSQKKTDAVEAKITNAEKLGFPAGSKVILLHCDDAGMCDEANIAVRNYFESGDLRSAAVMVPCPYAMELVDWAKTQDLPDVGVHLTLTSEWKSYRWGPVSDPAKVPGLIDPEGRMWHDVPEVVSHASAAEVETEVRAQIDRVIAAGFTPSHIDTHMGTMYASLDYLKVFLKIAEEYKIPANAIDLSDTAIAENFRKAGYPITTDVVELLNQYSLPKLDNFSSVPDGDSYEDKREKSYIRGFSSRFLFLPCFSLCALCTLWWIFSFPVSEL